MTSDRLEQMRELYRQVPEIRCQGLCWNSCGPIDMSTVERERIRERGYEIPVFTRDAARRWAEQERLDCPALNAFGRCSVYEDRPLICRLWGVAESMPCTYGCKPTRYLSDEEAYVLISKSMEIGGHESLPTDGFDQKMSEMLNHPVVGPLMRRYVRGERSVEGELVAAIAEVKRQYEAKERRR